MINNQDILVSVIVPVYNVEKYLSACVESIINQTYRTLEIILIDDGSTDNSGRTCDNYASIDERIIVIHQDNKGLSEARNAGLARCTGSYIAFIDSDDFYENDAIEYMLQKALDNNVPMVVAGLRLIDNLGKPINPEESDFTLSEEIITEYEFWNRRHYHMQCVTVYTKLYRRDIIESLKFKYRVHEDQAFLLYVIPKCTEILYSSKIIYNYRQLSSSLIHKPFALDNLSIALSMLDEVDYFSGKMWEGLVIRSFGAGTRNLCEGYSKLNIKEANTMNYLNSINNRYKNKAKELLKSKLSLKGKLRMLLFAYCNRLYFYICRNRNK